MKTKVIFFLLVLVLSGQLNAQLNLNYNPSLQPTDNIQYFCPKGDNLFVGDCIPFSHNGTYYLYWLLDSGHHSSLNGLGGHQWTLSTSTDLKTWKHYPIVIGIDEEWEKSICTGSLVFNKGKFYAFYATRLLVDGKVNEQLSYAISEDGIHFKKQKPNPFFTSAPGYSGRDFRDPKVFVDQAGAFHLLVSSRLENAPLKGFAGALVHTVSKDLKTWSVKQPVLYGQKAVPECPDYFQWNDWYYLVYSADGDTYYVKSKNPLGPWEKPEYQAFAQGWFNVAKTADFKNNRRIAAGWVPSRRNNSDDQGEIFGGNIVLRDLIQTPNGTLAAKFLEEGLRHSTPLSTVKIIPDTTAKKLSDNSFLLQAKDGVSTVRLEGVPVNSRISFQTEPQGLNEEFGLMLHAKDSGSDGYKLSFSSIDQTAVLHEARINSVENLDKKITIEIVLHGDIIDVEINKQRCLVNRLINQKGDAVFFYVKHGQLRVSDLKIFSLTN